MCIAKTHNPYLVTLLTMAPIFEWYDAAPRTNIKKMSCLKEIGLACSKHDNHSMLNSQHNWRDQYDYSMSTRIR